MLDRGPNGAQGIPAGHQGVSFPAIGWTDHQTAINLCAEMIDFILAVALPPTFQPRTHEARQLLEKWARYRMTGRI